MPDLENSARELTRVTFVNIEPSATDKKQSAQEWPRGGISKTNALRRLLAAPHEIAELEKEILSRGKGPETDHSLAVLHALRVLGNGGPLSALACAKHAARVSPEYIAMIAEMLISFRHRHALADTSIRPQAPSRASKTRVTLGVHTELDRKAGPSPESIQISPRLENLPATEVRPVLGPTTAATPPGNPSGQAEESRGSAAVPGSLVPHDLLSGVQVEPVGRMYLERISMSPSGMERGELVASVTLAPQEAVSIGHKEWATSLTEFQQLVQDSLEGYSESGVTEKSELAQATANQEEHSAAFTLSGRYAGFGNVAFGYNSSSHNTASEQSSRNQSMELTRKASARARLEHKVSFRVESTSGTETQSTRTISNPSATLPLRVDYYQLMRKWRVDLFRYGLRLTYDIVVPSLGQSLLRQVHRVREIDKRLAAPFAFALRPEDINDENWERHASDWGADVAPPASSAASNRRIHYPIDWRTPDESAAARNERIDFTVDTGFLIHSATFHAQFGRHDDNKVRFFVPGTHLDYEYTTAEHSPTPGGSGIGTGAFTQDVIDGANGSLTFLENQKGDQSLIVTHRYVSIGDVWIDLQLQRDPDVYRQWQFDTWAAISSAAENRHFRGQEILRNERERISTELRAQDALSLRRLEREAIMKSIIEWLLGPDALESDDVPFDFAVDPWSGWTEAYSELIRLIQHSVEWENVLYFTYPYFWDTVPGGSSFRLFLTHPDSRHTEFLRSGAARIVLTIRPGFEKIFLRLAELGQLPADADDVATPYLTIADEIRSYADTNYPGVPPANPPRNYRTLLSRKHQQAWISMQNLVSLLERFKSTAGSFPSSEGWFEAVADQLTQAIDAAELDPFGEPWSNESITHVDPWGTPWHYTYPGEFQEYDLASRGDGTLDPQFDLANWASASLIGRWYEYTPVSALDIELNTSMDDLA